MSRGGMRFGAGRPSHKVKAEHLQRVEIGRWHRGGYLRAGRSFTWSWHRGDEPTGNIGVLVHGADSLALQYMVGSDGQRRDDAFCVVAARLFGRTGLDDLAGELKSSSH